MNVQVAWPPRLHVQGETCAVVARAAARVETGHGLGAVCRAVQLYCCGPRADHVLRLHVHRRSLTNEDQRRAASTRARVAGRECTCIRSCSRSTYFSRSMYVCMYDTMYIAVSPRTLAPPHVEDVGHTLYLLQQVRPLGCARVCPGHQPSPAGNPPLQRNHPRHALRGRGIRTPSLSA